MIGDADLVNDWLSKNAPRRFERGASGTPDGIRGYLLDRGWELTFTGWKRGSKAVLKHRGRGARLKPMTMRELLAFVDELRAADGREPILRQSAA